MTDTADDSRLPDILESCYAALLDGDEPDLDALCSDAPWLRDRVEQMLERERNVLGACVKELAAERPRLPKLPDQIGEFVVLEPIGIGGMSYVFRARQEPLGREVALKVLRDELTSNETGRLRFTREASITATLEHPNIVPVFAAGDADGYVYLAMKLLRGRSLDRTEDPLSHSEVARIGAEVASALHAAHEVGVVHRDVKPANIVLEHGHAYVVDFGLAAFADQASVLTQPNATPGTLIYLPPEVASRKASNLDPRADVYGVGATLYELVAGRPPFDPSNPVRALQQIVHDEPKPLRLKGRDRDLETIVMRAMHKSPIHRYQSAKELAEELARYHEGLPILTRPPNAAARLWRLALRHPAISALLVVTLALAATLVTQMSLQAHRQEVALRELNLAADQAIARGDLVAARRHLDAIDQHPRGHEVFDRTNNAWRRAYDQQLLVVAQTNPITQTYGSYLTALRDRVARDLPAGARSAVTEALFGLLRWRQSRAALPDALADVQSELPRTYALLQVAATKEAVAAAAAQLGGQSGGAEDNLLAAIAMRAAELPESVVEAELRRADRTNRSPLLLHALAISLEAQGRRREAYEASLPLIDHPVVGALARWAVARLAAAMGEPKQAAQHVADALAVRSSDPLLRDLAYPSELQVLAGHEPSDQTMANRFWLHWENAPARTKRLPQYWRFAGYVRNDAAATLEDLGEARALFERGLTCNPSAVQRADLDVAIVQVEWTRVLMLLGAQFSGDDDQVLALLRDLAGRAQRLADDCVRLDLPNSLRADALVVAANCRLELGEWRRSRQLFDRGARYDEPQPLAEFALTVAGLASLAILDTDDPQLPPLDAFGDLPAAAEVALERANRVLLLAAKKQAVNPFDVSAAKSACIACGAYLGRARAGLHHALTWEGSGNPLDPAIEAIAEQMRQAGGVLLDRIAADEDGRLQLLLDATAVIANELRRGNYSQDEVAQIMQGWREHPTVAPHLNKPAWQPLVHAMAKLSTN